MVEVITTEVGVPSFIDDGTLVPIGTGMVSDVVFLEVMNPGSLDKVMEAMKAAVMVIAGIDPSLPDDEWVAEFNAVLTINEFVPVLNMVHRARYEISQMEEASA